MFFLLDLDIVWKLCIMLNANVGLVGFIFTVPCWFPQLWVHYRLICPRYYYWARTLWIHDKRFWNRCGKLEFKVTGEERHSLLTQYLKVYISVFTQNHFYWCQYTFSIVIRKTIAIDLDPQTIDLVWVLGPVSYSRTIQLIKSYVVKWLT